jgi:hypothetical protein
MKQLAILAAAFAATLAVSGAQAAMAPAPISLSAANVQMAGVVCGAGMHLHGVVCVPNGVKVCPPGWHLGPEGLRCRRN